MIVDKNIGERGRSVTVVSRRRRHDGIARRAFIRCCSSHLRRAQVQPGEGERFNEVQLTDFRHWGAACTDLNGDRLVDLDHGDARLE